jgi:hypothetical protein
MHGCTSMHFCLPSRRNIIWLSSFALTRLTIPPPRARARMRARRCTVRACAVQMSFLRAVKRKAVMKTFLASRYRTPNPSHSGAKGKFTLTITMAQVWQRSVMRQQTHPTHDRHRSQPPSPTQQPHTHQRCQFPSPRQDLLSNPPLQQTVPHRSHD